jgi:sialic acid synthase SpsE
MRELTVDGRRISDSDPAYVIAEVGHNHQGSLIKAVDFLDMAKQCGVDAVKLQKRDNRSLYTRAMFDQPYDHENSFGRTYGEHREALELDDKDWFELMHRAREIGITLFGTTFDLRSADFLAEAEDLNLRVIETLRDRFPDVVVGLSDHQDGYTMSLLGYTLGARVIEKHFTLSHGWKGTDHAFSLMPDGMRRLVRDLQRVPLALGDGVKRPLPCEEGAIRKMGKKLVAARDLPAGHVLAPGDIDAKSPADGGLPPYELERLVGRRLRRRLEFEDAVTFEDLEPVSTPVAAPGAAAER